MSTDEVDDMGRGKKKGRVGGENNNGLADNNTWADKPLINIYFVLCRAVDMPL